MSAPSANMSVWVGNSGVCIKIAGRASFTTSVDLKSLVNGLAARGQRHFLLDLSECVLMDSTFLGVLAGYGVRYKNRNGAVEPCIALSHPSPRISDLLANLGVSDLFPVMVSPGVAPEKLQPVAPAQDVDKKEISKICLEAHQLLMEIHPANIPKFKDVTAFLAEDLKRMEGGEAGPKPGA